MRLIAAASLYVGPLAGSNPKLIFQSDTEYVWPVAWHGGLLVLARGAGPYQEDLDQGAGLANPYSAISYHLVDPSTGDRRVLMGQCTVSGPLSAAGTACVQAQTLSWDGSLGNRAPGGWAASSSAASLSPDGALAAAVVPGSPTQLGFFGREWNRRQCGRGPGRTLLGGMDRRDPCRAPQRGGRQLGARPERRRAAVDAVQLPRLLRRPLPDGHRLAGRRHS